MVMACRCPNGQFRPLSHPQRPVAMTRVLVYLLHLFRPAWGYTYIYMNISEYNILYNICVLLYVYDYIYIYVVIVQVISSYLDVYT